MYKQNNFHLEMYTVIGSENILVRILNCSDVFVVDRTIDNYEGRL